MADPLTEILCLARLYLTDEETEHLVMWLANRGGRNQALAGNRDPLGRLKHIVRHWLTEEQREALANASPDDATFCPLSAISAHRAWPPLSVVTSKRIGASSV